MIFITGFPGFIATRLIQRFTDLNPDEKFIALVEPRMRGLAEEVQGQLKMKNPKTSVEILEGDITRPGLGIKDSEVDRIRSEVSYLFHLAAIYDLTVPRELAWKVNVDGTRHILDFLETMKGLKRFGYVSTCYVAGTREGKVLENDLENGQQFKNFYESTKYEAEILVRQRMHRIPTVIFRPAVVVGDSKTGDIPKFDGPYFALELIRRFRMLHIPVCHVGPSKTPFNVVPVDFVVNSAVHIFKHPEATGKTCQLADPNPPASGQLLELFCKLWDGSRVRGHLPVGLANFLWRYAGLAKLTGVPFQSLFYFNHGVYFDTTNTQKLTHGSDIRCPSFTEYAPVMVEYFKKHRKEKMA